MYLAARSTLGDTGSLSLFLSLLRSRVSLGSPLLRNSRDLENDFIIKLNAKKVLKLILKTLKKADDVSALPYAIIKSKRCCFNYHLFDLIMT